jgi:hypothetical protein
MNAMNAMALTRPRSESAMPDMTVPGERALRVEAARAGVTVQEYLGRLGQGLLYCYRCEDWHDAGAFGPDRRRASGRAASCQRSVREARRAPLRGALPQADAEPAGRPSGSRRAAR